MYREIDKHTEQLQRKGFNQHIFFNKRQIHQNIRKSHRTQDQSTNKIQTQTRVYPAIIQREIIKFSTHTKYI
jgi:hypothetical protein